MLAGSQSYMNKAIFLQEPSWVELCWVEHCPYRLEHLPNFLLDSGPSCAPYGNWHRIGVVKTSGEGKD